MSPLSMPAALTKKARKALVFRKRRSEKVSDARLEVPAIESHDDTSPPAEDTAICFHSSRKRLKGSRAEESVKRISVVQAENATLTTGKRKRPADADISADAEHKTIAEPIAKKSKADDVSAKDAMPTPRYILFIGAFSRLLPTTSLHWCRQPELPDDRSKNCAALWLV